MTWVIAMPLLAVTSGVGPITDLASFSPESLQCLEPARSGEAVSEVTVSVSSSLAVSSRQNISRPVSSSDRRDFFTSDSGPAPVESPAPFCAGVDALSHPACATPAMPPLASFFGAPKDHPGPVSSTAKNRRRVSLQPLPCPEGRLLGPGVDTQEPPVPPPRTLL